MGFVAHQIDLDLASFVSSQQYTPINDVKVTLPAQWNLSGSVDLQNLGFDELEDWLLETAAAQISKYDRKKDINTHLGDPSHKWRCISAVQKAIRRSEKRPAMRAAYAVDIADPNHLWRRLGVVALEDIAFGDPLLVATVYAMNGKMAWRHKIGRRKSLFWTIDRMAKAVKDRSLCDMTCWASADPRLEKDWEFVSWRSQNELADLMRNKSAPLVTRMLASWRLADTYRHEHSHMTRKGGDWKLWLDVAAQMGAPPLLRFIADRAFKKQSDAMFAAIPLVWEMILDSVKDGIAITVKHREMATMETVKNLPAPAFDMHTQDGKRALAYFAKACGPVRAFFEERPHLNKAATLGLVVFMVEGGLLKKDLRFAGRDDMEEATKWAELRGVGLDEAQGGALCQLVESNLSDLNRARAKVTD